MVREAICTLRDAPNAKLYGIANGEKRSSELAPDDSDDEQDQHSDDCNGDDAVRGHAVSALVCTLLEPREASICVWHQQEPAAQGAWEGTYRLAIPLNVLMLRSV